MTRTHSSEARLRTSQHRRHLALKRCRHQWSLAPLADRVDALSGLDGFPNHDRRVLAHRRVDVRRRCRYDQAEQPHRHVYAPCGDASRGLANGGQGGRKT